MNCHYEMRWLLIRQLIRSLEKSLSRQVSQGWGWRESCWGLCRYRFSRPPTTSSSAEQPPGPAREAAPHLICTKFPFDVGGSAWRRISVVRKPISMSSSRGFCHLGLVHKCTFLIPLESFNSDSPWEIFFSISSDLFIHYILGPILRSKHVIGYLLSLTTRISHKTSPRNPHWT